MDKIIITDVYLPVEEDTEYYVNNSYQDFWVEKHSDMIVITKDQFKQVLQLPVKFAVWVDEWSNWKHLNEDWGMEKLYDYWIENIYKSE